MTPLFLLIVIKLRVSTKSKYFNAPVTKIVSRGFSGLSSTCYLNFSLNIRRFEQCVPQSSLKKGHFKNRGFPTRMMYVH